MARPPFNTLGAFGSVLGCAAMAATLPGAVAGALGAVGITGSSLLARTLSPVAQPLFILSAALLVLGALACSRLVTVLAAAGTVLIYLSLDPPIRADRMARRRRLGCFPAGLRPPKAACARPVRFAFPHLAQASGLGCGTGTRPRRPGVPPAITPLGGSRLSMFQLASAGGAHGGGGAMATMDSTHGHATRADAPTFYAGAVLLVASLGLNAWRRRRRSCRPLLPLRRIAAG